jgi:hypothetical protein
MSYICCNQNKSLSTSIELNESVTEALAPNTQSNFLGKQVTITTKLRAYLSRCRDFICNNKAKCFAGAAFLITATSVTTYAILKQTQDTNNTEEPIVAPNVIEALTATAATVTEALTATATTVTATLINATTNAYKVKYLSCFDSLTNNDTLICETKQKTFDEYTKELNADNLNPFITNVYEHCRDVFTDKKCSFIYDPNFNNRVITQYKEYHIEASGNNIEYLSCINGDSYNTLFCITKKMLDYEWIYNIISAGLNNTQWNIEFCYSSVCKIYDFNNQIFSNITSIQYIQAEDGDARFQG